MHKRVGHKNVTSFLYTEYIFEYLCSSASMIFSNKIIYYILGKEWQNTEFEVSCVNIYLWTDYIKMQEEYLWTDLEYNVTVNPKNKVYKLNKD